MKNIQISLTAKNYADALLKLGQDNVLNYADISKNLSIIKEVIESSNDLKAVFDNPAVSEETKFSIIDDIFSNILDERIKGFLKILIEKKRFNELDGIIAAFNLELDKINNIQRVDITSAINLNDETKAKITEKLKQKLQKDIIANWVVNEDIIGGLVVQIDDNVIDSSLRNKLENLSKNII